jgi:hypothetical protein
MGTIFNKVAGLDAVYNPVTAAIKKYYRRKNALELSCSIYGPTITRDKIAVRAWILPVRSLQVIGQLFPEVKVGL